MPFTVSQLSRSTYALAVGGFVPDNYRARYTVFSVATNSSAPGEYRIGAKLASGKAPTAAELNSASTAITRTLGSTAINIYLPYHIEGTYFNTGVTRSYDILKTTILSPETSYKIYLTLADGSGEVVEVLEIRTDAVPELPGKEVYGLPPKTSYTHGQTDPLVLMVSYGRTGATSVLWTETNGEEADATLTQSTYESIGGPLPISRGYTHQLSATDKLIILINEDFKENKSKKITTTFSAEPKNTMNATFVVPD